MQTARERFSPGELAVVLSHYDLGVIESAKEFARGSRRSPKLLLQTARGRFLLGYLSRLPLNRQQRRAIPHLMVESLIAECVVPIAATGSFGHIPGFGVLRVVCRKVRWLLQNQGRLERWILE